MAACFFQQEQQSDDVCYLLFAYYVNQYRFKPRLKCRLNDSTVIFPSDSSCCGRTEQSTENTRNQ